jgi:hypothetical protein
MKNVLVSAEENTEKNRRRQDSQEETALEQTEESQERLINKLENNGMV